MNSEFRLLIAGMVLVSLNLFSAGIADWNPNMANEGVKVVDGVKWIDGTKLPIEGRAYNDVEHYYDRLPANVTEAVNAGVREMKHHTTGLQLRFKTSSTRLHVKWVPYGNKLQSYGNLTPIAANGIDVYRRTDGSVKWRYVGSGSIKDTNGAQASFGWKPGEECLINLPLYNGIQSISVGIDESATVMAPRQYSLGVTKPVVFYGTSITHGGCASRPGLAFVNLVGRELDVPIVNLGFSASGVMELEMSEHLARIDASCYVLDTLWNMSPELIAERYERFARNLRKLRPEVPIVFAGPCDVYGDGGPLRSDLRENAAKVVYDRLQSEGWKKIYWLPRLGQYGDDGEGAVDGLHPNDLGMVKMAEVFGKVLKSALGLK